MPTSNLEQELLEKIKKLDLENQCRGADYLEVRCWLVLVGLLEPAQAEALLERLKREGSIFESPAGFLRCL